MKPIIAYMAALDEAEYIEYAIRSTIYHVKRMIVIEGAWGCTACATGKVRSTDGTVEILERLKKEFDNLEVYYLNEPTQLEQRNKVFDYIKEDCWMLLQDADEVYSDQAIEEVKMIAEDNPDVMAVRFNSYTFINDFYSYTDIMFPRLFNIKAGQQYYFKAPNDILPVGQSTAMCCDINSLYFHHYSYCHSNERFMVKKKERTYLHGNFKWELQNGRVVAKGFEPKKYTGEHPEIMKCHPRYGVRVSQSHMVPGYVPKIIMLMQHSGIGNLVQTTPCLQAMRAQDPEAKIYLLTWPRSSRILEGLDCIDMVVPQDNKTFMKSMNRKIDFMFLSPVGTLFHQDMENMCNKVVRHAIQPPWCRHEADVHMDFARQLGYADDAPKPIVKIFPYNQEAVKRTLGCMGFKPKEYICINAAYLKEGQWPLKHWGSDKYNVLAAELVAHGYPVVFVGSEEDKAEAEAITSKIHTTTCINACGYSPDIKDTAELIANAKLIVGNDGGLMHIAAAVGTPTVTIFTFTNPIKNMPLAPGGKLVMRPCDHRISCQHGLWERCVQRGCLNVPVQDVLLKVMEVLEDKNDQSIFS